MGADPLAGDGAGMLLQLSDPFFRSRAGELNIALPAAGEYAVGMVFLPRNAASRAVCEKTLEDFIAAEGQQVLGWRDVPVDNSGLGESVKAVEPSSARYSSGAAPVAPTKTPSSASCSLSANKRKTPYASANWRTAASST